MGREQSSMEGLEMITSSFWKNRPVLVTGHTGFKGSWLTLWLETMGAKVYGFSLDCNADKNLYNSLKSSLSVDHSRSCYGDISNIELIREFVEYIKPEIVFHLAAQPLVRTSYKDPLSTWQTNVQGSLHVLESLKHIERDCAVVMVTTDKVYQNNEWTYGYRENDALGGYDPYSASKAAAEIAISSWRSSFCGNLSYQTPYLRIASARAGNVIGGGDWAKDRIIPDVVRSLLLKEPITLRNPSASRPWQHVLEPLGGYLTLAEKLFTSQGSYQEAYNFGPNISSNVSVRDLVEAILNSWPGSWTHEKNFDKFHEANLLHLQIDKAYNHLGWSPLWDFETTVEQTVTWYRSVEAGTSCLEACISNLTAYAKKINEFTNGAV